MSSLLTPRGRDLSRGALRILTGGLAFVAAAGTGAVTAIAAQESAAENAAKAAIKAQEQARRQAELESWAAAHPTVVHVARPTRTVVGPAVVVHVSSPGAARVGGSPATARTGGTTRSHGSGGTTPNAPAPAAPAPPPPPPPPPAPTTGS